jgi:flagellar basal-body rod protein FlgF
VTSEGLQVIGQNGPIVFQPGDREISISTDGAVSVREGANTTDTQRGKLKFASFNDPRMLLKDGTSTFRPPNGMQVDTPTVVRINQGAIEKSNVRSVVEMTRMVEVTRTYTQVAQLLQQHSDMRRTAIQQLAEVPA